MGYYVNSRNESKESFLQREGICAPSDRKISWESVPAGFLPVSLVDNGSFTAAGIAYSKEELDEFTRTDDPRLRKLYLVKIEKLLKVSDLGRHPDYAERQSAEA